MIDINMGPVTANVSELARELRAAIPGTSGTSSDTDGNLIVHIEADEQNTDELRSSIAAVIKAHDPAVLTREQQAKAARETAALAVRTANVTALRTGLEAKTGTVAQLQAQVAELAALVEAMRVALGLDEAPEGMG